MGLEMELQGMIEARAHLESNRLQEEADLEIESLKERIRQGWSPAKQLTKCGEAVDRAEKRADKAISMLKEAQRENDEAQELLKKKRQEYETIREAKTTTPP